MGMLRRKRFTLPFLILLRVFILLGPTPPPTSSAADNTNLVYKGCAEQKLQDPTSESNVKSLLATLVASSGQKTFGATTAGDGQSAITGVYQCRGDLTTSDCFHCISKIPNMLTRLCGDVAAAARVQLSGCYLRYEVVGFRKVPETQLLYKVCGSRKAVDGGEFEDRRESAFGMVVNGVKGNSGGGGGGGSLFYTGSYMSLYVLGQCEGNLGSDDCGACVKSAEDQAKLACGDSISAQIYLYSCFLSYSFYPNGVPTTSSSSGNECYSYGLIINHHLSSFLLFLLKDRIRN